MKTRYKLFLIASTLLAAGLIGIWPYATMNFAESARYTEKDKRAYAFYTPEILKNLPRITNDYTFRYTNIAGPGERIYELQFQGSTDKSQIEAYLEKQGYKKSALCDIQATCWTSAAPEVSLSVATFKDPATLIVSVVVKPSVESETTENKAFNPAF